MGRSRFVIDAPTHSHAGVDVVVLPATADDAVVMAATLNATQADLILKLGDKTVEECVHRGVRESTWARSGRIDGELVAMWGVYPLQEGVGYPWMYSTRSLRGLPRLAMSIAHRVIDEMLTFYPRLFGVVDSRFPESVNFAIHLGFTVGQYAVEAPFVSIERRAL